MLSWNKALSLIAIVFVVSPFSSAAEKRELVIGLGNFEPYFIESQNSGLFTELIEQVFAQLPHYQIKFKTGMSNYRLINELSAGRLDGAANIISQSEITGCISQPFFRFRDVAVTLKSRRMKMDSLKDLTGKKVVAYQGVKSFQGSDVQSALNLALSYREVPQPATQIKLIASGRKDVSIGDLFIFLHTVKVWSKGRFTPDDFEFHKLFSDKYTYMGFYSDKLCEEFDYALAITKKNGTYDAIYNKYLTKFGYHSDN